MADICFITTCMGRLSHLQQTLATWVVQVGASCIVVDYSCPDRAGDWVNQFYPQVQVVRVPGQTRFHLARARNAGAEAAMTPWLCFVDADVALDPSFTAAVFPLLRPGHFCRAVGVKELCGTLICTRGDFARVGGYDEIIQGWGCEDVDLYARLDLLGLVDTALPVHLVRGLRHDDDLRVRFYDNKRIDAIWTTNQLYSLCKLDLMKIFRRPAPLEERQKLYGRVRTWVEKVLAGNDGAHELRVTFRQRIVPIGATVESYLTYTLKLPAPSAGPAGATS